MTGAETNDRLPRWAPRAVALVCAAIALFGLVVWLTLRLQTLLVMLLMSLVFGFALEPAVNRLERHGVKRSIGTLATFVVTMVLAGVFLWIIGRLVANQVADLIGRGPIYIRSIETWVNDTFHPRPPISADGLLNEFNNNGKLGSLAQNLAPNIFSIGARVVGLLFQGLTVALFTFYLVADGPRLRQAICSALPPARQREVLRVWELGIAKTGAYIYSRALLAGGALLFHWLAFAVIGVRSPLALALWVGVVSQFVPVVGTYLAGLLPVGLALIDRPVSALWTIGVVIAYQQIENYLLAPRITAQTLEIHPALAFGSVLAGSAILGPAGALLALPLAATGTALLSTYLHRHELVESHMFPSLGPEEPPAEPADHPDSGDL